MPSSVVRLKDFRQGIDLSQGKYPDDYTILRDGRNIILTSGRKIRMRPPVGRLDVELDDQTQGLVYAGCKLCVIAKRGDTITHTGPDASEITTLVFDTPGYMDGDWTLLGATVYRNQVKAWLRHDFPGCGFTDRVILHTLDPDDPAGDDRTKPSYVEDAWCPTDWNADGTRPVHFFGKGAIGFHAPGFTPATATVAERLTASRPDGNVAYSGIANGRVWNPLKVDDLHDFGETWYFLSPDNGEDLFQFVVSDRFDKLDDDRAWSGYILEWLDSDGRWQKFVEVDDIPSITGSYAVRGIDGRWGDKYNEICLQVRWEGDPCTWFRWRATTGGPSLSVIEGGDLVTSEFDQREYNGDGSTDQFVTDILYLDFINDWSTEIARTAGGTQVIPLILGAGFHYVINPKDIEIEEWQATTTYQKYGSWVQPTTPNNFYYKCIKDGDSAGSEPTWPTTVGETVTDGSTEWETYDLEAVNRSARVDFVKHKAVIEARCDQTTPENRYTTNIRYDTVRYVGAFVPKVFLNEAEDVLVPASDYTLDNDDSYIRITWDQNLPAQGTIWTLKFVPDATDKVVVTRESKHFTGGRYLFEGEVWQFPAIRLSNLTADSSVLAGVPHIPLLFGVAGGAGGSGNQVFDTPGSYPFVVPAGVTELVVETWGAGGGGGGAKSWLEWVFLLLYRSASGGGGGGGGYQFETISVTPGETLTIEVGAGGAAGETILGVWPFISASDYCGSGPTDGGDGANTLIRRGAVVIAEVGGGTGGKKGKTAGFFPSGGDGGDGGSPIVLPGLDGADGEDGVFGQSILRWAIGPFPGGAGGFSGAADAYGKGGDGGSAASGFWTRICNCPDLCPAQAGNDGRVKLLWGTRINPWFLDPSGTGMPLSGYERYFIDLQKRLVTGAGGEIVGDEDYHYGNEEGNESFFYIEKNNQYQKDAGFQDAGFLNTAAKEQACGDVVALSAIKNRLGVHYDNLTQLWAVNVDPTDNFLLDSLHFGSRGKTADFFSGSMILTQDSFRLLDLSGLNYDHLQDNNYGRPIERVPVDAIHNARYWPFLGGYVACVTIDGNVRFIAFSYSREGKVAAWTIFDIRDLVVPIIDSFNDVGNRFYFRDANLVRYLDGSVQLGEGGNWYDDVDYIAYEAAVAANPDTIIHLEDYKYVGSVRFHHNDLGMPGMLKRWLWFDLDQTGESLSYYRNSPEEDAKRIRGATVDGSSLVGKRRKIHMLSEGLTFELESRDLDGWELDQVIIGLTASRR